MRVIIESPYAGDVERNTRYARACMLDSLTKGEAPFLSHLLYTQVLDDLVPELRAKGIEAGLEWGAVANKTVIYTDLGISRGMMLGIERARRERCCIEYRTLGGEWSCQESL